jgi:hypothetical protein
VDETKIREAWINELISELELASSAAFLDGDTGTAASYAWGKALEIVRAKSEECCRGWDATACRAGLHKPANADDDDDDDDWVVLAMLPRTKYRVVETANGWEVYGDGDPSFG